MEALQSNIKRLVAVDKKYHQAPVFIAPKEDTKTRKPINYLERLPEALRKDVSISLEPKRDRDDNIIDEMTVRIAHLQIFDLNNANDALLFEVVKDDSMVASSKAVVNTSIHRYYIEDKEKEATATIGKAKLKRKAYDVVDGLSTSEMENYAKILGKFLQGLSAGQIEAALYDEVEKDPQRILDVNNDKDLKYKIFLTRCVEKYYIHMDNGKYMNGKDLIGVNEDYAIQWLKDPRNSPIVSQWGAMLEGRSAFDPLKDQEESTSKASGKGKEKDKPALDLSSNDEKTED